MIHDYLVIGSGAGGCAAAYRLALAGKRVLLVEKGQELPADGSTLDVGRVIAQGVFKSREPWLDRHERSFSPEESFNLGGKTRWYGAALLRFGEEEFRPEPEFQCLGWPFSYRELEPYYREAENLLGIRRFDMEADLRALLSRLNGSAWQAQPLPLALDSAILADPREARHFDGFASAAGLKADGPSAFLAPIREPNTLQVLTGRPVRQLLRDGNTPQRVAGALLADGQAVFADRVLLAAGALHSPRLLQDYLDNAGLRPPCAQLVGRYYKRHLLTTVLALSPGEKTDALRKTAIWFNRRFPHSSVQPLGLGGDALAALLPRVLPAPLSAAIGRRGYGFVLQTEDGSHPDNRIEGGNGGPPRLDYDTARLPAARTEHRHMRRDFRSALRRAGCLSFSLAIPLSNTAHACGTLVTGRDPAASVVDPDGKVHGLDNLHVVDGSVLPRMSRVNPALTIYAWALRVADRLIRGERA